MTKTVDHEAEAKRYERLAKEARHPDHVGKEPEYYEGKAKEHRAKAKEGAMKKKVSEQKAISGLAMLVESELEKATVVNAAEGILEKLQKMASELASIEADDIMPILDSMRMVFGPEITDRFDNVTNEKIRSTVEAVKTAKEAITSEVARLKADVNGEPVNDLGMDDGAGAGDMGDQGLEGGEDMAAMDGSKDLGDQPELSLTGDEAGDETGAESDLDAAFDDAASTTGSAAGRERKAESIQRNIKALTESSDPDRLVFEVFKRTLKETRGEAVRACHAVATAFGIDFQDVVSIVKEGKTFKDEKDRSDKGGKSKDRAQDREDKKRDRPKFDEVKEGKTFKDEKDRAKDSKSKDYTQDRKDKKRDRPSELDEATFNGVPPKRKPFGKIEKPKTSDVPNNFDDMKKKAVGKKLGETELNEFEMKTNPAKKGMFKGKTEAELKKELNALKKSGPHKEGSAEFTKERELEFAIRAKSGWGKKDESKGFKTGGVVEGVRDVTATTRQKTFEDKDIVALDKAEDHKPSVKAKERARNERIWDGIEDDMSESVKGSLKENELIAVTWYGGTDNAGEFLTRSREEADKKAKEKRAEGCEVELRKGTAMTKIKENKLVASFRGPGSFDEARDLRDVLRAKGQTVFMEREGITYKVVQHIIAEDTEESGRGKHKVVYTHPDKKNVGNDRFEDRHEADRYAADLRKKGYHDVEVTECMTENAEGATVLVMKQAKKPKGNPFKAAARKLPKK